LHHERYGANFGLYFNVWDRLMATNHEEYEERFELATRDPVAVAETPRAQASGVPAEPKPLIPSRIVRA
jgi:sterol desaturase/sphingolipid hydroxylase (fatty acid hydroxylase superfamily)